MMSVAPTDPQSRLVLAIDFATPSLASSFIERIGAPPIIYKIGLELIYAGGLPLAAELIAAGRDVFLDAKLLDIGHTVERACASVAAMGAALVTVHASDPKTLAAAVRGRDGSKLKILGVTVLTNLGADDLIQQGHALSPEDLAVQRARLARDAGLDGVVASGWEAGRIKRELGRDFLAVIPGIRPQGAGKGDQMRVMTPTEAIHVGADYLVIGRPITQSADPAMALQGVVQEMTAAFEKPPRRPTD